MNPLKMRTVHNPPPRPRPYPKPRPRTPSPPSPRPPPPPPPSPNRSRSRSPAPLPTPPLSLLRTRHSPFRPISLYAEPTLGCTPPASPKFPRPDIIYPLPSTPSLNRRESHIYEPPPNIVVSPKALRPLPPSYKNRPLPPTPIQSGSDDSNDNDPTIGRYIKDQKWRLHILSAVGLMIWTILANDLNMAIYAMMKRPAPTDEDTTKCQYLGSGHLQWNNIVRLVVVISYYLCYVSAQAIGIFLAKFANRTTLIFWCQIIAAICHMLIPTASNFHFSITVLLRSVQGLVTGFMVMAMLSLTGVWLSKFQKNRFLSNTQAFNMAIGVQYSFGGFLITHVHWAIPFYISGMCAIIWAVFWWRWAMQPDNEETATTEHGARRRIEKRRLALRSLLRMGQTQFRMAPWCKMMKSFRVIAVGLINFSRAWLQHVLIICGPRFMMRVHSFTLEVSYLVCGTSFLLVFCASMLFSRWTLSIVRRQIIKMTNVRKVFAVPLQLCAGFWVVLIGFHGDDWIYALLMWYGSAILLSDTSTMKIVLDITPNYSAALWSLVQNFCMLAALFAPVVTELVLENENSIQDWRKIFIIAAGLTTTTTIIYLIAASAKVRPWDAHLEIPAISRIQALRHDRIRDPIYTISNEMTTRV